MRKKTTEKAIFSPIDFVERKEGPSYLKMEAYVMYNAVGSSQECQLSGWKSNVLHSCKCGICVWTSLF